MLVSVVSSLLIASGAFVPVGAFPCYDCGNSSLAAHNITLSATIRAVLAERKRIADGETNTHEAAAAPESRPQEKATFSKAISGGPANRRKKCAKPPTASEPPAEPSLPAQPPQEQLPKIQKQDSSSKPHPKQCKPRPSRPQSPVEKPPVKTQKAKPGRKACKPKSKTPFESSDQSSTPPPHGNYPGQPAEEQPQTPKVDEQATASQEQLPAIPPQVKAEEPAKQPENPVETSVPPVEEPENAVKGSDKPTYGTEQPTSEAQKPTYGTEQPAGDAQTPAEEAQKPSYGTEQPTAEPQTPTEATQPLPEAPQKPAQQPQNPAEEPQTPTEEPKQPSNPGFSKGRPGGNIKATAHVQYASSIGVLGCKGVDLSRIAFFPGTPGCDDFCVRVTYEGRSLNLLRVDSSGSAPSPDNSGTFDMSCQAYDYLVHGTDNKNSCKTGDRTPMSYETVDPRECKHLLQDGVLPISAPSPNYFVECANSPTFKDGGLKLALFNINDSRCEHGIDEECSWSGVGDPKCPSGLGTGSQRNPGLQISDPSYGG